jgi:hypothetical protein
MSRHHSNAGAPLGNKRKLPGVKLPWTLLLLGVIGLGSGQAQKFTAYDCSNRSNIVKS